MNNVAIIGAGISGLTLANQLKEYANVTVFEKARGVGGRMSTRYTEIFEFDHGAQYFTARTKEFKAFLNPFITQGTVKEWKPRILTISKEEKPYKRDWFETHYVASPRMNSLCKAVASDLQVRTGTEVATITHDNNHWTLTTTQQETYEAFDWVICSAPVPQAQKLMPKDFVYFDKLKDAYMTGCMSLMLGISEGCPIFFDAAVVKQSPIIWVAINSSKPSRCKEGSLLLQTSSEWAEANMENNLEDLKQTLINEAIELLPITHADIIHSNIHRWRYADVSRPVATDYLLDTKNHLAACGDWCMAGRVENGFLSGYRLATQLKMELFS